MRLITTITAGLLAVPIAIALAPMRPAVSEQPSCVNHAHEKPGKVPTELMAAVAKAFQIDDAAVRDAALVRCVGKKLMGCYVGANLNCDKADTRRKLPGATAWCRANPGSKAIPMAATGHATIFDWSCQGRRAVAGNVVMAVDPQGYVADNWKEIPKPPQLPTK